MLRKLIVAALVILISGCDAFFDRGDEAINLVQEAKVSLAGKNQAILKSLLSGNGSYSHDTWLDFSASEVAKSPNSRMDWRAEKTADGDVYLVSFTDKDGWGNRWEADLRNKVVRYVNESEYLSRKYGLSRLDQGKTFEVVKIERMGFFGVSRTKNGDTVGDPGYGVVASLSNRSGMKITSAKIYGQLDLIFKDKNVIGKPMEDGGFIDEISMRRPWLPNTERSFVVGSERVDGLYMGYVPEYVLFRISLLAEDPIGYKFGRDVYEVDLKDKWSPSEGRIGLGWDIFDGVVKVTNMTENAPAHESGKIKVGDEIVAVMGDSGEFREVKGLSYEVVRGMIVGRHGGVVTLRLKRGGEVYDVALKRVLLPFVN